MLNLDSDCRFDAEVARPFAALAQGTAPIPSQNRMPGEPFARLRSVRSSVGISNEAHYGSLYGENAALTPEQRAK
jgi:hypothetical protein